MTRPYGHAEIDPSDPRARGVCDRCGQIWNLNRLAWQYDWRGPRTQNLRFLVCPPCYDTPQMNGQRTYILPPDPVPVMNARPEFNVPNNNPMSAIGAFTPPNLAAYGSQIGNMIYYGGIAAAFDSVKKKPAHMCAAVVVSNSSYNNYVGINWTGNTFSIAAPSSLLYPIVEHSVTSYTITAPDDLTFGSTAYVVQGSPVAAGWGSWTTIASGSLAGTVGETISGSATGGRYQFHRVAFLGDGTSPIYVAQVTLSVGEIGGEAT